MAERRYPDAELWGWALEVAAQVHPLYVANDWRWFVENAPPGEPESKEVPSVGRVASAICQKAHVILDGQATSLSSGRLTVSLAEGDDEDPAWAIVVTVQLDDEFRLTELPVVADSTGPREEAT